MSSVVSQYSPHPDEKFPERVPGSRIRSGTTTLRNLLACRPGPDPGPVAFSAGRDTAQELYWDTTLVGSLCAGRRARHGEHRLMLIGNRANLAAEQPAQALCIEHLRRRSEFPSTVAEQHQHIGAVAGGEIHVVKGDYLASALLMHP